MKKKLLFLSMIFVCICLILTGCENAEEEDEEEKVSKKSRRNNVEEMVSNEEEYYDYYYTPIDAAHIELGDEFYIVVYRTDDDGNTIWEYETTRTPYYTADLTTEFLGVYNDEVVYLVDNGDFKILDAKTGKVKNTFDSRNISNTYYNINYDNGNVYILYGYNCTDLLVFDKEGEILKDIDLKEYDEELEYVGTDEWRIEFGDDNILKMAEISENENSTSKIIKVDLTSFDVSIENPEQQALSADMLYGKAIKYEYSDDIYYFYEDGTFEQIFDSNYAYKYSTLRQKGTWQLDENILILDVNEIVIARDGHFEYDENDYRILVDYEEQELAANVSQVYFIKYYPEYEGEEKIMLDGVLYNMLTPVG